MILKEKDIAGFRKIYVDKENKIYKIMEKECKSRLVMVRIGLCVSAFISFNLLIFAFSTIGSSIVIPSFISTIISVVFTVRFLFLNNCHIKIREMLNNLEGIPCEIIYIISSDSINDRVVKLCLIVNGRKETTEYFYMDEESFTDWYNKSKERGYNQEVHLVRCGYGTSRDIYRVFY